MAATTPSAFAGDDRPTWLWPLAGWQAIYALAAIAAAVVVATGDVFEGTTRIVAAVILGLVGVAGGAATWWIARLDHRGRLTSFVLHLLLITLASFFLLQELNVFNGLDGLGARFNQGLPYLGVAIIGWVMNGWANGTGPWARWLGLAAKVLMFGGFAAMLVAVGLFQGLWAFVTGIAAIPAFLYLLVLALAVFWMVILRSGTATRAFETPSTGLDTMDGILFVSPNILGFLAFLAGPLVVSLFISLTDWDGLQTANFIGLQNYVELFGDPFFLRSLTNIAYFSVLAIPLSIFPAIALATALNMKLPGMKVFRALYFLPSVAGVVGVALIWKQLFNATVGYINFAIVVVTDWINLLPFFDLTAPQPQWLSNPSTAMLSMVIVFVFGTLGFNTVLFLAGLQGVPQSLYEAAEIDGAGTWRKFRAITIPSLAPTTAFVTITTTILALQLFNEPFILNAPQLSPNGPDNATLTPVIYLYQNGFERFDQGYASAIGWVLFLIIFLITIIYFRTQGDEGVLSK
ncbi:MAG: sugar ABC transporter permease [Acidimicrobiia bacterium]